MSLSAANQKLKERLAAIKAAKSPGLKLVTTGEAPVEQPVPEPVPVLPVEHISVVTLATGGEYEQFKMKLATLEQQLNDQVPDFASTLRDVHRELSNDSNIVTILSPAEIGLIVSGLAKHTYTTIVPAKNSSGKSKGGRTQPVSADDL
jgi:hypothetical protein